MKETKEFEPTSLFAAPVVRRFAIVTIVAAIVLLVIVASLYIQDVRHREAILEREGSYVVALEKEFLSREFRAVHSDLLYLAQQEALRRFLSGDETARGGVERDYVRFAQSKSVYDQIRCLDTAGQEIVRVNFRKGIAKVVPRDQLQTKAARYYYRQALSLGPGEVLVSPFDLNVEHGRIERPIKPVVRFLTPVFDESGEKRALLILNYLGAHLLAKLKEISAGFRGESMLINQEGEYLRSPDPDHEWGWLRGHEHSFRRHYPQAWARGKDCSRGQFRVDNALFTFERVSPVRSLEASLPGVADDLAEHPADDHHEASPLLLVSRIPFSAGAAGASNLLRQLLLMYAGTMLPVAILALYWARSVSIREHQERRLAESESRLRLLSSRLLAAQEAERRDLSRNLHDELGQLVTAISLDLKSAAREDVGEHARSLLERAIHETEQLLRSVHAIASRVRPSVLDDLGLKDALESFVLEYEQRTGIAVNCDLRFQQERIPPTVGENVYRVFQEALSNAAAHARSAEVSALVAVEERQLRMVIEDSGVGFRPERSQDPSRLGILGMRERVELLDGVFELTSRPGEGTRIAVSIPLEDGSHAS